MPDDPEHPTRADDDGTAILSEGPVTRGPEPGERVATPPVAEGGAFTTMPVAKSESPTPGDVASPHSGAFWDTIESGGQLAPGQLVFGRYVVQRMLGRGGMGTVWLVRHRELDADRALKMIVAGIAFDNQARARFRREAQVMARFSHPNAVVVHDARLTEEDVAFIEMEFIQGQSLDKVLKRGVPMSLEWTGRLLEQLCDALQVAHEHQIVHRDLKPSNLMLVDGRPEGKELLKVLDFGIAKILGEGQEGELRTYTGSFMGTPPYASPEQADGHADLRSDIYSVGVILFEFLTGFRPFTGPAARLISDTLNTPAPPFAAVNPEVHVPEELEKLVMQCLAKDPAERPQSARALAEAFRQTLPRKEPLDEWLPGVPQLAPPSLWPKVATAVGLLLFALAIVVTWMQPWKTTAPRNPGDQVPTKQGPSRPEPPLPAGYVAENAADRVGRYPKLIVRQDQPAATRVRLVYLEGGTFEMGPDGDRHPAPVPAFYIQESEVTNAQMSTYFQRRNLDPPKPWKDALDALLSKQVSPAEANQHPAVGITHAMAEDFAQWAGGRLPTEAEWEYAARSRGLPDHLYVWGQTPRLEASSGRANVDTTDGLPTRTTTVKNYPLDITQQRVYDLMGNVREWCRDPGQGSPGTRDAEFITRGGSWRTFADQVATTAREFQRGDEPANDLGFRIVIEWPPKAG